MTSPQFSLRDLRERAESCSENRMNPRQDLWIQILALVEAVEAAREDLKDRPLTERMYESTDKLAAALSRFKDDA